MKKKSNYYLLKQLLLVFAGIICFQFSNAQSITWTAPVEVPSGGNFGSTRPRVTVCNGVPVFIWSNESTKKVYASRYASGVFSTPVQVTPGDFEAFTADWTGPEVASSGDTLFVTFTDHNTPPGPAYVVRSLDGGIMFGDTVRVPLIGDELPRLPAVSVINNNPVVTLMRFNSSFGLPDFTVSHSMNGGNSFMPYIDATGPISGEPCDCCPGSIITSGNNVAVLYRNNDSNIRDMWAALSDDGGNTFTNTARIDSNNWMLMSCPSSGPAGYFFGDTLVSVFMNGGEGSGNKVYVSSIDVNTMQVQSERKIFNTMMNTNQNYPRIAGTSDTLGVVWKQSAGASEIFFSGSFNGPTGIGNIIDTLTNNLTGSQAYPDIAYGGGWFHVVFENQNAGKVYYMAAAIDTATSTSVVQNKLVQGVFSIVSKTKTEIVIELNDLVEPGTILRLLDVSGRIIYTDEVSKKTRGEQMRINTSNINSGLYFLQFSNGNNVATQKIEILK